MRRRLLCIITIVTASAVMLGGNRPVPKWQGFSHRPLDSTVNCARHVLQQFGRVSREDGERPEAGSVRLFLHAPKGGKATRPVLTTYFDGDAAFTSAFMDANDPRIADRFWHKLQDECRILEVS